MFEINNSQLIQYEILEKLVTYIGTASFHSASITSKRGCPIFGVPNYTGNLVSLLPAYIFQLRMVVATLLALFAEIHDGCLVGVCVLQAF